MPNDEGKEPIDGGPDPESAGASEPVESRPPAGEEKAAGGEEPAASEDRRYDPRELPIEVVVRILRLQMADKDWRSHRWHHALYRTIDEDPAGAEFFSLAFDDTKASRRQKATARAWDRAQRTLSASSVGRSLGAEVRLVPGGGRWFPKLHIPFLGGGFFENDHGFRTPLAALTFVERRYRILVIGEGVT